MATIVKGKICLCKTSLSDWVPERVNGILFYDRYQEFAKLFSAKIPEVNFEKCFAQPVFNDETNIIEWFCMPMDEFPSTLEEVPDETAKAEKKRITDAISRAAKSLSENDLKYIKPILLTLNSEKVDTITYHYNGQVIFGIWGMSMKKGKVIADVIIDDIKDHRTHHVIYKIKGKGKLTFSDIVRRHGHILGGDADIPEFTPAEGFLVQQWLPESPSGVKVDKTLVFTIVFAKDPYFVPQSPPEEPEPPGEPENPGEQPTTPDISSGFQEGGDPIPPHEPKYYNVVFTSDERGMLRGQTEYRKKEGDHVFQSEIPYVDSQKGYRFVRWSQNPRDYVVNGDTEFTAQYEPIEPDVEENVIRRGPFWWLSGCLNTLLAFLLLMLIGLLLWFLLANHNLHFCGGIINDCNCDEEVVEDPDPKDPNKPVQSVCDATTHSGSNHPESYIFDMGMKSGTFLFEYGTGNNFADRIIVYDGKTRKDKMIFNYYGTTGDCNNDLMFEKRQLHFTNQYILVDVIPDQDGGTCWTIKPNCPN